MDLRETDWPSLSWSTMLFSPLTEHYSLNGGQRKEILLYSHRHGHESSSTKVSSIRSLFVESANKVQHIIFVSGRRKLSGPSLHYEPVEDGASLARPYKIDSTTMELC